MYGLPVLLFDMRLTASTALQVVDCYFPKDRALNRRKNFCFVTFATQQVHFLSPLKMIAPTWHMAACLAVPMAANAISQVGLEQPLESSYW